MFSIIRQIKLQHILVLNLEEKLPPVLTVKQKQNRLRVFLPLEQLKME